MPYGGRPPDDGVDETLGFVRTPEMEEFWGRCLLPTRSYRPLLEHSLGLQSPKTTPASGTVTGARLSASAAGAGRLDDALDVLEAQPAADRTVGVGEIDARLVEPLFDRLDVLTANLRELPPVGVVDPHP